MEKLQENVQEDIDWRRKKIFSKVISRPPGKTSRKSCCLKMSRIARTVRMKISSVNSSQKSAQTNLSAKIVLRRKRIKAKLNAPSPAEASSRLVSDTGCSLGRNMDRKAAITRKMAKKIV